jgi:hypothetical protein
MLAEYLGLTIVGEENTTAYINVRDSQGGELSYDVKLGPEGYFQTDDLMGRALKCGGVTYTVVVALEDRAKNIGFLTEEKSITTSECPRCMGGTVDGWQNPLRDSRVRVTSPHRTVNPDRRDHDGIDINIGLDGNGYVIQGNPVYPVKPGVVTYVRYNYTDDERWTSDGKGGYKDTSNYVQVDHGDGFVTRYVHLQYSAQPIVTAGQEVGYDTILGYMGNTGQSTGPHLHLTVLLNGSDVNPDNYINTQGTNLSGELYEAACDSGYSEGQERDDRWDNLEMPTPTLGLIINQEGELLDYVMSNNSTSLIHSHQFIGKDKNETVLYGLSMYKNMDINVKVIEEWIDFGICEINNLGSEDDIRIVPVNDNFAFGPVCKKIKIHSEETTKIDNVSISLYNENKNQEIRNFWNDTSGEFGYKDDQGNLLSGGRWLLNNQLPGNSNSLILNNDFEYGDTICSQAMIFDTFETTNNKNESISISLNGIQSKQGCRPLNRNYGIDEPFIVEKINQGWDWNNEKVRNDIPAQNIRNLQFDIINERPYNGGFETWQSEYDGSEVWIVIHGWYNDPNNDPCWEYNYMIRLNSDGQNGKCNDSYGIAQQVADNNPDAIVLALDWREASGYQKGFLDTPITVNEAAKWITPTARSVKTKLNEWGLEDANKLNFVGHSLGTLLSAEISEQFNNDGQGKANVGLLLDPASQLSPAGTNIFRDYDLDGNTPDEQTALGKDAEGYFRNRFAYSRVFVGANSVAGSDRLSQTAHDSFELKFNGIPSGIGFEQLGKEHFEVIETFYRLNDDTKLYDNYFDYSNLNRLSGDKSNNDFGSNVINSDFEGQIDVSRYDSNNRNYTNFAMTRYAGVNRYYGTEGDNEIYYSLYGFNTRSQVWGGSGNDKMDGFVTKFTRISDYKDEKDVIRVPVLGFSYDIIKSGEQVKIIDKVFGDEVNIDGDKADLLYNNPNALNDRNYIEYR